MQTNVVVEAGLAEESLADADYLTSCFNDGLL